MGIDVPSKQKTGGPLPLPPYYYYYYYYDYYDYYDDYDYHDHDHHHHHHHVLGLGLANSTVEQLQIRTLNRPVAGRCFFAW